MYITLISPKSSYSTLLSAVQGPIMYSDTYYSVKLLFIYWLLLRFEY